MAAAGFGLQVVGNIQANRAQAKAERFNAQLFEEQAKLSILASKRERHVFDLESDQFMGAQVNAFSKAGVDISGSALAKIASTKQQISAEGSIILENGRRAARSSLLQAQDARSRAKRLRSFGYNFMQSAPSGLAAAGMAMNSGS